MLRNAPGKYQVARLHFATMSRRPLTHGRRPPAGPEKACQARGLFRAFASAPGRYRRAPRAHHGMAAVMAAKMARAS